MSRSLTLSEKVLASRCWPRMSVDDVVVTDEPTPRYNCLAWTLGVTNAWVWPWGIRSVSKAEFDAFYWLYGFVPAASGRIAVFGADVNTMTHACVVPSGEGPAWESKCGAWLRIRHALDEMEGGNYGDVLGFYERASSRTSEVLASQRRRRAVDMKNVISLTAEQMQQVRARAARVNPAVQGRFARHYAAWQATWNDPTVFLSSAPAARAQSAEFRELLALGQDIVPLLMEKLTEPDEFFALVAVDRLLPQELVVKHDLDDEAVLLGEQGRAIETVQRWLDAGGA